MTTPVHYLLKDVERGTDGLHIMQLLVKVNAPTLEDLAKYSRNQLEGQTSNPEVVGMMETILQEKYGLQFSQTYRR